jgi:hypothetical protein
MTAGLSGLARSDRTPARIKCNLDRSRLHTRAEFPALIARDWQGTGEPPLKNASSFCRLREAHHRAQPADRGEGNSLGKAGFATFGARRETHRLVRLRARAKERHRSQPLICDTEMKN